MKKLLIKDLLVKSFNGQSVYNFVWNGKPCWVAIQVARVIGYKDISRSVLHCLEKEKFIQGHEYEILSGPSLKEFKSMSDEVKSYLKQVPKLVIFYEEGLYGYLQYTNLPIGVELRKWIRREVMPQIRKTGSFTLDKSGNLEKERTSTVLASEDKLSSDVDNLSYSDFTDVKGSSNMRFSSSYKASRSSGVGFDLDKFSRFKDVTFNVKIFKELMDSVNLSDKEQLIFLRSLFEESGMDLPFLDL